MASVAVQETGVVPTGNELPELGVQATTTGSLTPLTSGGAGMLKTTLAVEVVVDARTSASGPKSGGVVSTTVTFNRATTFVGSVTSVHVTWVVPIGKREPGAGSHVVPEATLKVTIAPPGPVASA